MTHRDIRRCAEKHRERDTHREAHKDTRRDRQRHTYTKTHKKTHIETQRDKHRNTHRDTDTQRHTEAHRDTQRVVETRRDPHRQERHAGTQKHTQTMPTAKTCRQGRGVHTAHRICVHVFGCFPWEMERETCTQLGSPAPP